GVVELAILGVGGIRIAVGIGVGAAGGLAAGQRLGLGGRRGWGLFLHHRLRPAGMGIVFAHHLAAQNAARARNRLGDGLGREIVGDAALLFGRCRVDQPHQKEE